MLPEPSIHADMLAKAVIGAAIEVHRELGPGFSEAIYEEALAMELAIRNIPFERQKVCYVEYRSTRIGECRLDFLIDNELILELKAVEALAPIHTAQVLSYLKTTGYDLALLINFNVTSLKLGIKRIIRKTEKASTRHPL